MSGTPKAPQSIPLALFLDIDGTLVNKRQGPFAEDIAAIELARQQGHKVFLNTGRSMANIPPEMQNAAWVDGIIAGGGAQVALGGKTIYHTWVPEGVLCAACGLYLTGDKWIVFEGETDLYNIHLDREYAGMLTISREDDFRTKYAGAIISKITMGGYVTAEEEAVLGGAFDLFPQRGYSEGIIKGESKAKGMKMILEAVGIKRENSIAVGDSANDAEMIRYAGLGIAMGNGTDELKKIAGAITGDVGHGGVAQAITHWML
ncbi:haloacid dehalogenase [Spirochaetia bacterium]|nr:haloacid dehalogenase [Spirochaetia bacterium]